MNPIQTIAPDSDIPTTSNQATTESSDPSILEELVNHNKGELPGFEPNLEKAFEMASDEVVLKDPQQYEPNSQMALNTCSKLIIHPDFKPILNLINLMQLIPTYIFGIALRNLANKKSSTHKSPVVEHNITDIPCSSNQICPLTITPNVSPPPTLLLDSAMLVSGIL